MNYSIKKKIIIIFILFNILTCSKTAEKNGKFKDDLGNIVPELKIINSVVSLAPNITEILFFLEKIHILKGVTAYCNYPSEVLKITKIGGIINPDFEKIIHIKPQIVFASYEGNSPNLKESFLNLEIPVYVIKINSINSLFVSIRRLAEYFKCNKKIKDKIKNLELRLRNLKNKLKGKRIFFQFGGVDSVYTFGNKTIVSDIVKYMGGINLGDLGKGVFPKMNREMMYTLKPDLVVVLLNDKNKDERKKIIEVWNKLYKKAKIIIKNPDILSRPGPRIINAFENMVQYK